MLTGKRLGALGERLADEYLRRQGYRIRARNYRTALGEIDIVAEDGDEIVFVEVKTRLGSPSLTPEESVTPSKVGRLERLAEAYLMAEGLEERMCRIDVVAIVLDSMGRLLRLDHFRDAVY